MVQGETAANSIIEAIKNACQDSRCDVLILTRGGGSLEDLWCFNDELLANEIFNCPIPIVSGVGHEVDFTISDLVADHRAPTPTAAAEMLSPDTSQLQKQLRSLWSRLTSSCNRYLQQEGQNVDHSFQQLVHPAQKLNINFERLNTQTKNLQYSMQQILLQQKTTLNDFQYRLQAQRPDKLITQLMKNGQTLANRLVSVSYTHLTLPTTPYV